MTQRSTGQPATTGLAGDLDRGFSLPATWYTDPAIVELERERIFRWHWQYVGRTAQVSEVGDYFTSLTGGDLPVVIVRSEDGLQAFVNVCRHRRHEVMSGAGNRRALQCPYHAWTYGLDGRLRSAPRSEREEGFDKEDFLDLFLGRRPSRIGVSKGSSRLSAVVVEVEVESRRAIGIEGVYKKVT